MPFPDAGIGHSPRRLHWGWYETLSGFDTRYGRLLGYFSEGSILIESGIFPLPGSGVRMILPFPSLGRGHRARCLLRGSPSSPRTKRALYGLLLANF